MPSTVAGALEKIKAGSGSLLSEVPRMLAVVAKQSRAQASAIAEYLAQRRDQSVEEYNAAIKVKARVEHRLGEVLAVTVNHKGGGHNKKHGDTVSPCSDGIPEGVDKKQSSRAQQFAEIPWPEIERRIDKSTEAKEKASIGKIAREFKRERQLQERATAAGTVVGHDGIIRVGDFRDSLAVCLCACSSAILCIR